MGRADLSAPASTRDQGAMFGLARSRPSDVGKLKIRTKQINRISMDKYSRIALVDAQPGIGDNSLRMKTRCRLVIDHHPRRRDASAEYR